MNIEIINIGDELLIGQVVNTNASWMASRLNDNGMDIIKVSTIADKAEAIEETLQQALKSSDIVLISGGLGPTKDDITKTTLCRFFNSKLIENADVLENIKTIFASRGYVLTETNRKQAEVPECCKVLPNALGTAPGMWFEQNGKIIVSLPGVPFEMKALMDEQVIPLLKVKFQTKTIIHRTILTQGIGESFLSDKLENFEAQLPKHISLAYLPNVGTVRLRLSGRGISETSLKNEIDLQEKKMLYLIKNYVIACEDSPLEEIAGKILLEKNYSLSIAESCTGGYISHKITSIPGSSAYFKGSVVSYSNEAKENILGVNHTTLENHGAVSEQTAKEMALGAKQKFNTDFAIATSGIAGPGGGTPQKPIGTVWIAVATPHNVEAQCFFFAHNAREQVIQRSCNQALALLLAKL